MVIFSVSFVLPKNTTPSPRVNLYHPAPVSSSIVCFHVMSSRFENSNCGHHDILLKKGTNLQGKFHVDILRRFRRKTLRMRTRSYQRIVLEIN